MWGFLIQQILLSNHLNERWDVLFSFYEKGHIFYGQYFLLQCLKKIETYTWYFASKMGYLLTLCYADNNQIP